MDCQFVFCAGAGSGARGRRKASSLQRSKLLTHVCMCAPVQWEANWYPVALVRDLDPGRPTALKLLGERLVVWRDGAGQWRCFADRCPHRLVPLSEGRIESDGTLLCSCAPSPILSFITVRPALAALAFLMCRCSCCGAPYVGVLTSPPPQPPITVNHVPNL